MDHLGEKPGHNQNERRDGCKAQHEFHIDTAQIDEGRRERDNGIHRAVGDPRQSVTDQIEVVCHTRHEIAGANRMEIAGVLVLQNIEHFPAQAVERALAALFQQDHHHIPQDQPHHLHHHHEAEKRQQHGGVLRRDDVVNQFLGKHGVYNKDGGCHRRENHRDDKQVSFFPHVLPKPFDSEHIFPLLFRFESCFCSFRATRKGCENSLLPPQK